MISCWPSMLVCLLSSLSEELSAAVTMELLYYYARSHQDSFDGRLHFAQEILRSIFLPLSRRLILTPIICRLLGEPIGHG